MSIGSSETTSRGYHRVGMALLLLLPVVACARSASPQALSVSRRTAAAATQDPSGVRFDGRSYTNRLIDSPDPYLLLHAHNPVDWYPWGPAALEKARRENKPIFLSIGYSTCYWCHVAEREIYSNPEIAKLMNRWFVNIKVDREQRPDIDRVYMLATEAMTGAGGWPNNVFLTPDLKPFFAGSYFPPTDEGGRAGFPTILASLHQAWIGQHAKVVSVSARVYHAMEQVDRQLNTGGAAPLASAQWLALAAQQAMQQFDPVHGGFSGGGPMMFPQAPLLSMLLSEWARDHDARSLRMVTATLRAMAEGGVMDQLAGGFHRYSTDPTWSIPHFEKMLSDNAQLLGLYAQAYVITGQPLFKEVALRTARYLTGEMRSPHGGFYSAQDSQIDNVESVSYVWTRAQIETVLGATDGKRFFVIYTLTPMPEAIAGQKQSPGGVLRLRRKDGQSLADRQQLAARIDALAPLRAELLAARNRRPQPAIDAKIVTAENGLAILGFVEAGRALHDASLTRVGVETANWEWDHAFDPATGRLQHQFFHGRGANAGFLDDYALLGQAFLALRAVTGEAVWRQRAQQIADAMLKRFQRPDGTLATTTDTTDLLLAPPAEGDSVQPSGESAAVALLLGLAADGGSERYATAARRALAPLSGQIAARPIGWGALLASLSQPTLVAALNRPPASGTQAAFRLPDSADHVHATAQWAQTGEDTELRVAVAIDEGYHINANPASDPHLIPTTLTLDGYSDLKVQYPPPQVFKAPFAPQGIAVYTGRVDLRALLPHQRTVPIQARLRVQACNDRYCLMPATLAVAVKPPTGERK